MTAKVFTLPYVEDQRRDDPEQYRLIGFVGGRLVTFIVEYREDTLIARGLLGAISPVVVG